MMDLSEYLGTGIFALFVTLVALGPGPDQARRLLRPLEKDYATRKALSWSVLRPVLRASTSADEKLSAVASLIGRGKLDASRFRRFEDADKVMIRLEKLYRTRYYGLVVYIALLFVLIVFGWLAPSCIETASEAATQRLSRVIFLLATAPTLGFLVLFVRIGLREEEFSSSFESLEESLGD